MEYFSDKKKKKEAETKRTMQNGMNVEWQDISLMPSSVKMVEKNI